MVELSVTPLDDRAGAINEWQSLFGRVAGASFFQSPAWVRSWLGGADGVRLFMVRATAGDDALLLGVVSSVKSPLFGEQIYFHEFGDAALDANYVEYNDFLIVDEACADQLRVKALQVLFKQFPTASGFVFRNCTTAFGDAVQEAGNAEKNACR